MTSSAPAVRARRRTATLAVVLCAGLTAALAACGSEDPDKGTNGVGKLSAPEIEKKTRTAVDSADAVRLAGTLVSKGGTYKIDMRLKDRGGAGSVTSKNSSFTLLRIGEELYLKADAGFWSHADEGKTDTGEDGAAAADKLEDKYVKVPQDDPTYKQLSGFTDKKVLLDGMLTLHGELSKGDRDEIRGKRTIRIMGGEGAGGSLDVALDGKPYPLRFARGGGGGVITLADWGKDFSLKAPPEDETVDYGRQLPRTSPTA
ncbi:hypothetical protein [Streptomyces sp. NBC_00525]|uniref:hypothetical protein n=1 Tax=Streptomyces sp. NBC_00525 TaxID=2903660 RepID=UPI002E821E6D|nr:hypothetical protein [Streptomyces sp. NBC_00525]WUC95830.1 hypothetical protein OG710_20490 [Streptomyces sp. NBC_00525]